MSKITFGYIAHYPAPLRLGIFVLTLLLIWLPLAAPIYWLVTDKNWVSILTLAILYLEFVFLIRFWGKQVYQQRDLLQSYGLEMSKRNAQALVKGLGLGLFCLFALFIFQGILGWVVWQLSPDLWKFVLEGLLLSLGVGFAEELVFRGWLLDELERDYSARVALWVSSLIFALLHFIKPVEEIIHTFLQFPGLVLLGLILVLAKRSTVIDVRIASATANKQGGKSKKGLLGLPIGFHGGLVWGYYIIDVGKLARYSDGVPIAIAGVNGNPLAGLMGLLFLSAIAFWAWKISRV